MIEIRKAKTEDATLLNQLLTLLIHDEKKYDANINENFKVVNMYENYIDDQEKCILVAWKENEIIGYLYGYKKEKDNSTHDLEVKLDALYVKENYRHCGVATQLIDSFKIWARENHAKYIDVNVWNDNLVAKNLYIKHQFFPKMETLRYEFLEEKK